MTTAHAGRPHGVPEPEEAAAHSGSAATSAADSTTEELTRLRARPLAEHAPAYERIHDRLTSSLATIDTA